MGKHLQIEIENLKKRILTLSTVVEEHVQYAVRSVEDRDITVAKRVLEIDSKIDKTEIEVEEECLKILALHQPVATDLRFIIAVLKLNNDLERISDLAVNIAERTLGLVELPPINFTSNFPIMAEKARLMLRDSLDSLVNMDSKLALHVCASDDEVDELYRQMFHKVKTELEVHPKEADYLLQMLSIARHLERIADHTTNIAEDVIYMIEGDIIRHGGEKYKVKG